MWFELYYVIMVDDTPVTQWPVTDCRTDTEMGEIDTMEPTNRHIFGNERELSF